MMRAWMAAAVALVFLGGCGLEGPPERPKPEQPKTGVTISGDARMGVVKRF